MATTPTKPSRGEKIKQGVKKAGHKVFGTLSGVEVSDHVYARLAIAQAIILVVACFALFAAGMAGDHTAYTFPDRMGRILALALVVYVICFIAFTPREGWKKPWPQLILVAVLAVVVFFVLPFWLRLATLFGIARFWWGFPPLGFVVSVVGVWLLFRLVFRLCAISTTDPTITAAQKAVDDRQATYDALNAQYEGHQKTFNEAKNAADELQEQKADIDKDVNAAGIEHAAAQTEFDKMVEEDTTVVSAQQAVDAASKKVTALGGDQKRLDKESTRANIAAEPFEDRLDELKVEITQAQKARNDAKEALEPDEFEAAQKDPTSDYSLAQSHLKALVAEQKKVTSLLDAKTDKDTQLQTVVIQLDDAKKELTEAEGERDEAQKALNDSTPEGKRLAAAKTAFDALTTKQADVNQKLATADKARDQAQKLMTSASDAKDSHDKKTGKKRAKLEEVHTTAGHNRRTWWWYTFLLLIGVLVSLPAFYGWVLTQRIH